MAVYKWTIKFRFGTINFRSTWSIILNLEHLYIVEHVLKLSYVEKQQNISLYCSTLTQQLINTKSKFNSKYPYDTEQLTQTESKQIKSVKYK